MVRRKSLLPLSRMLDGKIILEDKMSDSNISEIDALKIEYRFEGFLSATNSLKDFLLFGFRIRSLMILYVGLPLPGFA